MASSPFIGIDSSVLSGKSKKPDLSYWVGGQYITDAQGNRNYVITSVVLKGQRPEIIIDL
jgi:hypothetical protein